MNLSRCTLSAPAQAANFLGLFDRMGFCCSLTPISPFSERGGPGNLITVERMPGASGTLDLTVYMRRCDPQCNWLPPVVFTALHQELAAHPERDIVRRVAERTLRHIGRIRKSPVRDGLLIEVTIHSPNGMTGLGLGGSASSAAVAMAIDQLYGSPVAQSKNGQDTLLLLMGQGERVASGRIFYDNVAPLLVPGDAVYVAPARRPGAVPRVHEVKLPRGFHLVTITPEYSVSTKEATERLKAATVPVFSAEAAASGYLELAAALAGGDLPGIIANASKGVAEPVRAELVPELPILKRLVDSLNGSRSRREKSYACGISGSGPTMYVVTDSASNAQLVAAEATRAMRKSGVNAWAFVHTPETRGAQVLE